MRFAASALVLAALSASEVFAATIRHGHFHAKKSVAPSAEATRKGKRTPANAITAEATDLLKTLGISQLGYNLFSASEAEAESVPIWIGDDGSKFTNEFHNNSTEPIVVLVWSKAGSWVNAIRPYLTISLEPNETETISIKEGTSGAWAAVYGDTTCIDGQVANTWGEFTLGGQFSTINVSREPFMSGHSMRIDTNKGEDSCVSDMEKCVFVCKNADRCMYDYELRNCEVGSQPGAHHSETFMDGGCLAGESANLKTTFM